MKRSFAPVALLAMPTLVFAAPAAGQSLPVFDFTRPGTVSEWRATHDAAPLETSTEGMVIRIRGGDPYIHGPARDYPPGKPLWLRVRLLSETGGMAQFFYYTDRKGTSEDDSVRFNVAPGRWVEARLPLPPLEPGQRLRFDPPGTKGVCTLAGLRFEERFLYSEPELPGPTRRRLVNPRTVKAGGLLVTAGPAEWGSLRVVVDGIGVAIGNDRPRVCYLQDGKAAWFSPSGKTRIVSEPGGALRRTLVTRDPGGAAWTFSERLAPSGTGAISVQISVAVSKPRKVLYLPMLMVHPGSSSFGQVKNQALFGGLEYLDSHPSEVSSSEADLEGPQSRRQVPDSLKITLPLMVIAARSRYVGLMWETNAQLSALFDSPDRIFRSGGHAMGLIFPHSDGENRVEGNLLPYDAAELLPGKPVVLRATLLGGTGHSVIPAIQQYIQRKGLPSVPRGIPSLGAYAALAAEGWLQSKIRQGPLYRHAYWPGISGFEAGPAADAATFMLWLSQQPVGPPMQARLREGAKQALAAVPPGDWNGSGVSHVRYPVQSLLFGHIVENLRNAAGGARNQIRAFEPDGRLLYRQRPGSLDYGRTHYEPDANGLTAASVQNILDLGCVSGDEEVISEGLRLLRALGRFLNTAPRGAQTWEVPLHTPDILASAHLVRAYTTGYELTGDRQFLEAAKYWAWTGVPFLYLEPPTKNPIGLYASIPVLGATQWKAPNWMGLPVQWCGLVYADALYRFVRHDPSGPWKRIADGITASGIQQSFEGEDPDLVGLLPDSYDLRTMTRNPVAINPGTVQANAVRFYTGQPLYDRRVFLASGPIVHAAGTIETVKDEAGVTCFRAKPWPNRASSILLSRAPGRPARVKLNGRNVELVAPHEYHERERALVLQVSGPADVEIEW